MCSKNWTAHIKMGQQQNITYQRHLPCILRTSGRHSGSQRPCHRIHDTTLWCHRILWGMKRREFSDELIDWSREVDHECRICVRNAEHPNVVEFIAKTLRNPNSPILRSLSLPEPTRSAPMEPIVSVTESTDW